MSDAEQLSAMPRKRSTFRSPSFLLCALLLAGTALGLRPGMAKLAKTFQKQSISLRKPLDQFDSSRLTSFRAVPLALDQRLDLSTAGTKHALLAQFVAKGPNLPQGRVTLLVTYYSNPGDKVPHTPEVCYRQGATTVESLTTITIDTPALAPKSPRTNVRLVIMRQPASSAVILYLFYVNGQVRYDRQQVRWIIYRPGDRYVYFSKIEVILAVANDTDPTATIECCKKFLGEVLPVLIKEHFPDDAQLR